MYLYLRADLGTETLPAALVQRAGRLTEVMQLTLTPARQLARADVSVVIDKLGRDGFYLQMPPQGHIQAFLYEGD